MEIVKSFFDKKIRLVFISTVILMLLSHGFCFTNVMYSHDSLDFTNIQGLEKVGLGRFFYPFFVHRRLLASPWLVGALSIIFVSLSVVLVTKLLDFSIYQAIMVGVLFSTNISLTALFCTYIHDADADCLALLLACFAVYSFKKFPQFLNILIPIISVTLSLALYQAYICMAIGLFLLILINDSLKARKYREYVDVFFSCVKFLFILLAGTALYIRLMYWASRYYMTELSSGYNGAENLSHLRINDIITGIPSAYKSFRNVLFGITEYNTRLLVIVNHVTAILLIISLIVYLRAYYHSKIFISFAIVIPSLLIFPLGINAISLVSFGVMHQLMFFSFCIVYLLPQVVYNNITILKNENAKNYKVINFLKDMIFLCSILTIILMGCHNIIYSNGAYLYKKLVYDNTQLHAQIIWIDVNRLEGYIEGKTPVVFVGDCSKSNIAYSGSAGDRYQFALTGASNSSITYPESVEKFYRSILGRDINIVSTETDILQNSEFADMPVYPYDGYCRMIDGVVVVKL